MDTDSSLPPAIFPQRKLLRFPKVFFLTSFRSQFIVPLGVAVMYPITKAYKDAGITRLPSLVQRVHINRIGFRGFKASHWCHIVKKGKGNPEEFLNKLFGSVTRARILCFLYALPGQNFYQREILYETGLSPRPVQRELNNLLRLGIIKRQTTKPGL